MTGMPQPNEHHTKLHRLAGTWIGEETLSPSPWGPGGRTTGRYTGRVDIDGFFVIQDYVQEKQGQITYRGHGIFGWDDRQKSYIWYWIDSMGEVPPSPSRGQWQGDTLMFEHEPMGDRRGRYTFQFPDQSSYRFKIENSQDGGKTWQVFMEATYRKSA
jgi:hypothetical protein